MTERAQRLVDELVDELRNRRAWGEAPVVMPRPHLADLLPGHEELLESPLLAPAFVQPFDDGKVVDWQHYCARSRPVDGAPPVTALDRSKLDSMIAAGAGVKFNRVELWNKKVEIVARSIEAAVGKPLQVWAFLSAKGSHIVAPHRDPAHVIAIQVLGHKRWQVDERLPNHAWTAGPAALGVDAHLLELNECDVLYVPYGSEHAAVSQTARSFHIAFAIRGGTVGEFEHRVLGRLVEAVDGADSTELTPSNVRTTRSLLAATLRRAAVRLEELSDSELDAAASGALPELVRFLGRAMRIDVAGADDIGRMLELESALFREDSARFDPHSDPDWPQSPNRP